MWLSNSFPHTAYHFVKEIHFVTKNIKLYKKYKNPKGYLALVCISLVKLDEANEIV